MRLPRIFRTTPFRLTLLFLALFASAASAFLAYIYVATAGEATRRTDQEITREMQSLVAAYDRAGIDAVNQSLIERAASERPFLYLLMSSEHKRISGSIEESPVEKFTGPRPGRPSRSPTSTARAAPSSTRPAACRKSWPAGRSFSSAPTSARTRPTSTRSSMPCRAPAPWWSCWGSPAAC
jgi:hypothetical protein